MQAIMSYLKSSTVKELISVRSTNENIAIMEIQMRERSNVNEF